MTYQQQIKHPNWQRKRLEVLEFNHFKCQICGKENEELHVHHPFYRRGAMIWEYDKKELQSLCHVCHKNQHAIDEQIKKELALVPIDNKPKVLEFIKSLPKPKKAKKAKEKKKSKEQEVFACSEEQAKAMADEFFRKVSKGLLGEMR